MAKKAAHTEIPKVIFDLLSDHVTRPDDRARVSCLSRISRISSQENPLPNPWLMLPFTTAMDISAEYYIRRPGFLMWRLTSSQDPLPLPPPDFGSPSPPLLPVFRNLDNALVYLNDFHFPGALRDATFLGSFPGGWVALGLPNWRGYAVLNVHNGELRELPALISSPDPPADCPVIVQSIAFSAAPTPQNSYVIAAITSGLSNIALWRPGLDRWRPPTPSRNDEGGQWQTMLPQDMIHDLFFHHERLYVVNSQESLLVYVVDNFNQEGQLVTRMIRYQFPANAAPERFVIARYLLEHKGQLLMVRLFEDPDGFEIFFLEEEATDNPDLMIGHWRTYIAACGLALFLQQGGSTCVELSMRSVMIHRAFAGESWYYM